ncbi:DUF1097 domain-containing protein [Tepidibacter formicigenes]|jgi:hypothetical protein|uniref:DUF1097 domain-containing protein n=1 Tax=Tepidibacter formicigenes DSM 15518 TaxID=1123349 RepID=A0A1M6KFV2_9FIRM|nr:DUF1097 domain-containing protein [Tepidibacter formicigenes]SHJ57819.1 Protein of unknown function [Tepidibacter formicigenes DSM 15518]
MIIISELLLVSLFSAVIAVIWGSASFLSGIFTWVGFAGWTSFCVVNETDSLKKAIKSYTCNLSGIFWASTSLYISNLINIPAVTILLTTGIVTVFLIYQSKFKLVSCVPCCFIGCFITFGLNGDYKMAATGLLCGAILGYLGDKAGILASKIKNKNNNLEIKKAS